jgi:hypothetical protein
MDEEEYKDIPCLYCLVTSREMWIQCAECKLRSREQCADGSTKSVCLKISNLMKQEFFS